MPDPIATAATGLATSGVNAAETAIEAAESKVPVVGNAVLVPLTKVITQEVRDELPAIVEALERGVESAWHSLGDWFSRVLHGKPRSRLAGLTNDELVVLYDCVSVAGVDPLGLGSTLPTAAEIVAECGDRALIK